MVIGERDRGRHALSYSFCSPQCHISLAVPCSHSELICIYAGAKLHGLQLPFFLSPHSPSLTAIPPVTAIHHRLHFIVLTTPSRLTSFPNQPKRWGSVPLLLCQDVLTTYPLCTSACQAAGPGSVLCLDLTTPGSVLADAAFNSKYPGTHTHPL